MNATASVLGILLKSKSVEASYIKIHALNEFMKAEKFHLFKIFFIQTFTYENIVAEINQDFKNTLRTYIRLIVN